MLLQNTVLGGNGVRKLCWGLSSPPMMPEEISLRGGGKASVGSGFQRLLSVSDGPQSCGPGWGRQHTATQGACSPAQLLTSGQEKGERGGSQATADSLPRGSRCPQVLRGLPLQRCHPGLKPLTHQTIVKSLRKVQDYSFSLVLESLFISK